MSERRKRTWVYDEWEPLTLQPRQNLTLEERRVRWLRLYERTFVEGRWVVDHHDAALVATMSTSVYCPDGEYGKAKQVLRSFFDHPDLTPEALREVDLLNVASILATLELLDGEIDIGLSRLRNLPEPRSHKWFRATLIRNALAWYAESIVENPDPRCVAFLREQKPPRGKKKILEAMSEEPTRDEMISIIEQLRGR